MSYPRQQWDPGDPSSFNQYLQGQQYPEIRLYHGAIRYPPGRNQESAPVQPGDVNFSQARMVADTSAEQDGSHSLIYNPVMQSPQVPQLDYPFPIQATRSNSCSSSSSSDVENDFNVDIRGETNNEKPDSQQSNSGFSETGINLRPRGQLQDWVQPSPADIGATHVEGSAAVSIPPDASVQEGLCKLYGIRGYEEKRITCYTTFTNNGVTPGVASRYADRLCYMSADRKVQCAGCQRTVDFGANMVHESSCPIIRICKNEWMQGSPSHAVADTRRKLNQMGYTDATIEAVIQKFGEEILQSVNKFVDKLHALENSQLSQKFQTALPHNLALNQPTLYETAHAENPNYLVRYPMYEHMASRLGSFAGRESAFKNIHPKRLAEAGFFYSGCDKYKDMVRCFSCDGAVMSWAPNDDPWEEHARIYPNCRFVLYEKGGKFVDSFRV